MVLSTHGWVCERSTVEVRNWGKITAMWNIALRMCGCAGVLRHARHQHLQLCSSPALFYKFLPYSSLSVFLLLARLIKDLNVLRMGLRIDCLQHFRNISWSSEIEKLDEGQEQGARERSRIAARTWSVISLLWLCTTVWGTHKSGIRELSLPHLWSNEKSWRKY